MGMFKFYMRSKRAFPLDYALNMPGLVTRSGEVARALSLGKVYREWRLCCRRQNRVRARVFSRNFQIAFFENAGKPAGIWH